VAVDGEVFVVRIPAQSGSLLGIDRPVEHAASRLAAAAGIGHLAVSGPFSFTFGDFVFSGTPEPSAVGLGAGKLQWTEAVVRLTGAANVGETWALQLDLNGDGTPDRTSAYAVPEDGRALSRDDILARCWGAEYEGTPRTVDNFVRSLRVKLERDPEQPRHFLTVRGHGYRFEK